ncbi:MAG: hypothetical protein H6551_04715 [Chitinophagales bacterium]|nr:hypothetical protein [Chitinophagaceae bacterium]MCB9064428.1 hypothetical protein [Chitinophagales bacterium]
MKKVASIAMIALFAVSFTACKKKWTCECTSTVNGVSTTVSGTDDTKRTKKDAKALCEGSNGTTSISGVSATIDCKLK